MHICNIYIYITYMHELTQTFTTNWDFCHIFTCISSNVSLQPTSAFFLNLLLLIYVWIIRPNIEMSYICTFTFASINTVNRKKIQYTARLCKITIDNNLFFHVWLPVTPVASSLFWESRQFNSFFPNFLISKINKVAKKTYRCS